MRKSKPYWFKILIWLDQGFNVILLNGSEDHTISGRVGYKAMTTEKRGWIIAEYLINKLFFFDPDHCRSSIEYDEVGTPEN